MKDYYLILGIEPKATQDEIKKAYRNMSLKYHPDKNQGDKYFEERFKDIQEAYSILNEIESRKEYDYLWVKNFSNRDNQNDIDKLKEAIRQKESLIRDYETKLKSKDIEIASALSRKSSQNINWIYSGLICLIVGFTFGLFTLKNKEDRTTNENLYSNPSYSSALPSKSYEVKKNPNAIDLDKFMTEELSPEKNKKVESKKKVVAIKSENNSKNIALGNKTFIEKNSEIGILNLIWDENYGENLIGLEQLSIKNYTDKELLSVTIEYDVLNSAGTIINTEEFSVEESDWHDRAKHYSVILAPKKTKQFYVNSELNSPHKKYSEKLILRIKEVKFKD